MEVAPVMKKKHLVWIWHNNCTVRAVHVNNKSEKSNYEINTEYLYNLKFNVCSSHLAWEIWAAPTSTLKVAKMVHHHNHLAPITIITFLTIGQEAYQLTIQWALLCTRVRLCNDVLIPATFACMAGGQLNSSFLNFIQPIIGKTVQNRVY